MLKTQQTVLIIATILLITGLLYIVGNSKTDVDFVRALDETPEKFERKVISSSKETRHLTDTTSIFRPAQIRISNNFTYVNDFADFTIYEYDSEGNQKRKLTTTRGRGPGEIQHLTDFDVKDDTIWIADSQNLRVTSYSLETGEYVESHTLENRPMRVTILQDSFVVQWLGADKLFSTFDFEGNELFHFGDIVEDQALHQMSIGGTIRSNRQDRFVYIPFYASLIYHFHSNGELINILKAPGIEFPAALRDGPTTFAPDFSYMSDGFIDENDNLYVYTRLPDEIGEENNNNNPRVSYLDKYNLRNAEYVKSLRIFEHYISVMYNPVSSTIYGSDMERSFIHQLENPF